MSCKDSLSIYAYIFYMHRKGPSSQYKVKLNNYTFTIRVTVSPTISLSISDNTDMTPWSLEILNRPCTDESVKKCEKNIYKDALSYSKHIVWTSPGGWGLPSMLYMISSLIPVSWSTALTCNTDLSCQWRWEFYICAIWQLKTGALTVDLSCLTVC